MKQEEILKSLCYYDKRNPDCTADDEEMEAHIALMKKKTCTCDNCFYGRTKLAEELLKHNQSPTIMESYVFARKINGTDSTGIVDITKNPPELICLCSETQSVKLLQGLNTRTLFLVGKATNIETKSWEFAGVFATEDIAIANCHTEDYFLAKVEVGKEISKETVQFDYSYYPLANAEENVYPPQCILIEQELTLIAKKLELRAMNEGKNKS